MTSNTLRWQAQYKKVTEIFTRLRAVAARKHPVAASFSLAIKSDIHDSERHYGQSLQGVIYAAPELEKLAPSKIVGVIAHEIAHMLIEAEAAPQPAKGASYDEVERNVDRVAEATFHIPIYYDEKGIEDTDFDPAFKRPRPPGLR